MGKRGKVPGSNSFIRSKKEYGSKIKGDECYGKFYMNSLQRAQRLISWRVSRGLRDTYFA